MHAPATRFGEPPQNTQFATWPRTRPTEIFSYLVDRDFRAPRAGLNQDRLDMVGLKWHVGGEVGNNQPAIHSAVLEDF